MSASYVTDRLLDIAQRFDNFHGGSNMQTGIFRSLMKFHVVERLLPDHNKRNNLMKYYERLRVKVPWQVRDPQYWVQYAMARIIYNELDKAEYNLRRAYEIASKKYHYDTAYINAQYARVMLLRSIEDDDSSTAYTHFREAHQKLVPLVNDVNKFRQVFAYEDVFLKHFRVFAPKQKVDFEHACNKMLTDVKTPASMLITNRGSSLFKQSKDMLERILAEIRAQRSK
jgi:phenylpropionate dioxygenase-like ring-hydroxylating dioxygenase large terminal subunit